MQSKLNFDSYFYFLAHKLIFMGFLFGSVKTLLYICRIKLETMEDKFNKEDLEFYLPNYFKGLSKQYLLKCIFSDRIQNCWKPKIGDLIVGRTGNIFAITAEHKLNKVLGGDLFFFGGGLCNRDGGCTLNETYSYTMNKSGKWIQHTLGGYEEVSNCYHSAFSDFRYIPYPHEIK